MYHVNNIPHWTKMTHDEYGVHLGLLGVTPRHVDEYTPPRKPHEDRQQGKAVELRSLELNQYAHKVETCERWKDVHKKSGL